MQKTVWQKTVWRVKMIPSKSRESKLDKLVNAALELKAALKKKDQDLAGHAEADLINALRELGYEEYFRG